MVAILAALIFRRADLEGADLRKADLESANFEGSTLGSVRLEGARNIPDGLLKQLKQE
ncbi:MAG: pentapeptide repeat-containing protein [bacterium]